MTSRIQSDSHLHATASDTLVSPLQWRCEGSFLTTLHFKRLSLEENVTRVAGQVMRDLAAIPSRSVKVPGGATWPQRRL